MMCNRCPLATGCQRCKCLPEHVVDWIKSPQVDMCLRCALPFDGESMVFFPEDIAGPFHLRCALSRITNKVKNVK